MAMTKQINYQVRFNPDTSAVQSAVANLQTTLNSISTKPILMDDGTIRQAVKDAKELQQALQNATNVNTGKLDITKFSQQLKASGKDLQDYASSLKQLGPQGQQAFMQLAQSISQAQIPMRQTNRLLSSLWTNLKNVASWQISSTILTAFTSSISNAVQYTKDLNKNLNDIRIVSGQSASQMEKFAESANKAAKALSASTNEYTKAALIYYQQGLNDQQVKERTDATIKMANVTGESADDVSSYMTAIWNNFDNGSKSLEYYADVMTALGAATASSTDEIATGLEKFAGIAETVGLSYEYATSALATLVAQTRQSPETVGTALKTIFSRLQGLKLGETLEDGTNLNKYSEALLTAGVNIKESNGELKDMDVILNELGNRWDYIGKAEKMALAQTVGGVRQYTQLITLMDNWDEMQKNVGIAMSSTGELDKQAAIYAESWEAASERTKASLEALYSELVPEDLLISFTDTMGSFVDSITALIDGVGGLGPILIMTFSVLASRFIPQMINGGINLVNSFKILSGQAEKTNLSFVKQAQEMLSMKGIIEENNLNYQQQLSNTQRIMEIERYQLENAKSLTQTRIAELDAEKEKLLIENQILEKMHQQTLQGQLALGNTVEKRVMHAQNSGREGIDAGRMSLELSRYGATTQFSRMTTLFGAGSDKNTFAGYYNKPNDVQGLKNFVSEKGQQIDYSLQSSFGLSSSDIANNEKKIEALLTEARSRRLALTGDNRIDGRSSLKKNIRGESFTPEQIADNERIKKQLQEQYDIQNKIKKVFGNQTEAAKKIATEAEKMKGATKSTETNAKNIVNAFDKGKKVIAEQTDAMRDVFAERAGEAGARSGDFDAVDNVALDNADNVFSGYNPTTQEDYEKQLKNNYENTKKERTDALTSSVQGFTTALSGAYMAMSAIQSLGNIWNNDDLTFGEKMSSILMSSSMLIPGIISSYKGLKAVISGVSAIQKTSLTLQELENMAKEEGITLETVIQREKAKSAAQDAKEDGKSIPRIIKRVTGGIAKSFEQAGPAGAAAGIAIGAIILAMIGQGIASHISANIRESRESTVNAYKEKQEKLQDKQTKSAGFNEEYKKWKETGQVTDALKDSALAASEAFGVTEGKSLILTNSFDELNKKIKELSIDDLQQIIEQNTGAEIAAIGLVKTAFAKDQGHISGGRLKDTMKPGSSLEDEKAVLSKLANADFKHLKIDQDSGQVSYNIDANDKYQLIELYDEINKAVDLARTTRDFEVSEIYQKLKMQIEENPDLTGNISDLREIINSDVNNNLNQFLLKNAPTDEQITSVSAYKKYRDEIKQLATEEDIKEEDFDKFLIDNKDLGTIEAHYQRLNSVKEKYEDLSWEKLEELYDKYGDTVFNAYVNLESEDAEKTLEILFGKNKTKEAIVTFKAQVEYADEWAEALLKGDTKKIEEIFTTLKLTVEEQNFLMSLSPEQGEEWIKNKVDIDYFSQFAGKEYTGVQSFEDQKELSHLETQITDINSEILDLEEQEEAKKKQAVQYSGAANALYFQEPVMVKAPNKNQVTDEITFLNMLSDMKLFDKGQGIYSLNLNADNIDKYEDNIRFLSKKYGLDDTLSLPFQIYSLINKFEDFVPNSEDYNNWPWEDNKKQIQQKYVDLNILNSEIEEKNNKKQELQSDYSNKIIESQKAIDPETLTALNLAVSSVKDLENLNILYSKIDKNIGNYFDKAKELTKENGAQYAAVLKFEKDYNAIMNDVYDDEEERRKAEKEKTEEFREQLRILEKQDEVLKSQKNIQSAIGTINSLSVSQYEKDQAYGTIAQELNNIFDAGSTFDTTFVQGNLRLIQSALNGNLEAIQQLNQEKQNYLFEGENPAILEQLSDMIELSDEAKGAIQYIFDDNFKFNSDAFDTLMEKITGNTTEALTLGAILQNFDSFLPKDLQFAVNMVLTTSEIDTTNFTEEDFKTLQQKLQSLAAQANLNGDFYYETIKDWDYNSIKNSPNPSLAANQYVEWITEIGNSVMKKRYKEFFKNFNPTASLREVLKNTQQPQGASSNSSFKDSILDSRDVVQLESIIADIEKVYAKYDEIVNSSTATDEEKIKALQRMNDELLNSIKYRKILITEAKKYSNQQLNDLFQDGSNGGRTLNTNFSIGVDASGNQITLGQLENSGIWEYLKEGVNLKNITGEDRDVVLFNANKKKEEINKNAVLALAALGNNNEAGKKAIEIQRDNELALIDWVVEWFNKYIDNEDRITEAEGKNLSDEGLYIENRIQEIELKYAKSQRERNQQNQLYELQLARTEDTIDPEGLASRIEVQGKKAQNAINEWRDAVQKFNESKDYMSDEQRSEALIEIMEKEQSAIEAQKEAYQELNNVLEKYQENLDHIAEIPETGINIMNNYKDILDNMFQENSKAISALNEQLITSSIGNLGMLREQRDYNKQVVAELQQLVDEAKARGDQVAIDEYTNQLNEATSKYRESEKELVSELSSTLEEITSIYEEALEQIVEDWNKAAGGIMSNLEMLSDEFDKRNDLNEQYLDEETQIYELEKMRRTINKELANNKNLVAQSKLQDVMEQINKIQREGIKLSEYDLKMLQARYDLRKAEIALEEAQNNKTEARLVRNAQGNWTYVFTANQNAIEDVEQKVADEREKARNESEKYSIEMQQNLIDLEKERQESLAEAYKEYKDDEEALKKETERLNAYYVKRFDYFGSELGKALKVLGVDFKDTSYAVLKGYDSWTKAQDDFREKGTKAVNSMEEALSNFKDSTSEAMEAAGYDIDTFATDLQTNYLPRIDSAITMAFENFAEACDNQIETLKAKVKEVMELMETMMEQQEDIYLGTNVQDFPDYIQTGYHQGAQLVFNGKSYWTDKDYTNSDQITYVADDGTKVTLDQKGNIIDVDSTRTKTNTGGGKVVAITAKGSTVTEQGNGKLTVTSSDSTFKAINVTPERLKEIEKDFGLATGGYTGDWNSSEGRMAILHEKELVLNKTDTKNILSAVDIMRNIIGNANFQSKVLSNRFVVPKVEETNKQEVQQEVHIQASFPGVQSAFEIETALNNIINDVSQYAGV